MVPWHISVQRLFSVESRKRRGSGTGAVIRASSTCAQLKPYFPVALRKMLINDMGCDTLDDSPDDDGGWHLQGDGGTEDFDNQITDVRMQDSKRQNRGKDLAGNDPAVRHVRTECQRAKRTLSSSTQATIDYRCSA